MEALTVSTQLVVLADVVIALAAAAAVMTQRRFVRSIALLEKAVAVEQHANSELREVDDMRNAFLMAISHELRTLPPDQVQKSIDAIATQSKKLERLLTDLLDVERLTRGIVEPNIVDTDVTKLILLVVEQSSAGGRIRTKLAEKVPARIDPALLERMVENLVINAIKHTPSDSDIWVSAERLNGHLNVSVEDSGKGVPDELKTAIFEPFKQGKVPGTRRGRASV